MSNWPRFLFWLGYQAEKWGKCFECCAWFSAKHFSKFPNYILVSRIKTDHGDIIGRWSPSGFSYSTPMEPSSIVTWREFHDELQKTLLNSCFAQLLYINNLHNDIKICLSNIFKWFIVNTINGVIYSTNTAYLSTYQPCDRQTHC